MDLPAGTLLASRYEIGAVLGRGGLSTVYRARDLLRGSAVALKLVELDRTELVRAFQQEFTALIGLYHPHLPQVHDFGRAEVEGRIALFYTADLVEGSPADVFAEGRSWDQVRPGLIDGLRALGYLHRAGLRHGDFKPQNLLIDAGGRGTLIDLSCVSPPPKGTVSGTLGFLAPELISGGPADHRADLFALGRTLEVLGERVTGGFAEQDLARRLTRPDPTDRPVDVDEVLASLGAAGDDLRPPDVWSELLGREGELERFGALVEGIERGEAGPRFLCFAGPPGIGRSRLLREIKWRAQLRCRVVEGNARAGDGVTAMLRRAIPGTSVLTGLRLARTVRDRIAAEGSSVLFVLDDVHLLAGGQRALLEGLARIVRPTDPIGVVGSSLKLIEPLASLAETRELAPLDLAAARAWSGGRLPESRLADLMRVTGGIPGEIRALLSRIRSGAEDLLSLASGSASSQRIRAELEDLGEADRRALGIFAALDGVLGSEELAAFRADLPPERIAVLTAAGWLVPEGGGIRLTKLSDAPRLARNLGAEVTNLGAEVTNLEVTNLGAEVTNLGTGIMLEIHGRVADWLTERKEISGRRTVQLLRAGRIPAALELLEAHGERIHADPGDFRRAAEVLVELTAEPRALLRAAEIFELAGDPRRAIELIRRGSWVEATPEAMGEAEARLGSCSLKLGDAGRARDHLDRALGLASSPARRAEIADLKCRALIQAGEYRETVEVARRALQWAASDRCRADLHESLGAALTYLGEVEPAREHLDAAEQLSGAAGRPRSQVRALSYRAILEYRLGRLGAAAERYRRALELAEEHGLADQIASCALNLGTIAHRRADWGPALDAYRRGLEVAVAVGKVRTEVALRYDLAQLCCDIGQLGRARQHVERARERAVDGELPFFRAACAMLEAEIDLWSGDAARAEDGLLAARAQLDELGAAREVVEVEIHLVELGLAQRDLSAVERRLDRAKVGAGRSGAEDLAGRIGLLAGRLALESGDATRAITTLEEARSRVEAHEERDLVAEIDSWLAMACDAQGAAHAARRFRRRALELWDRSAATLEPHLREAFWAHPRRRHLARAEADRPPEANERSSSRERKLERLLAINARLNSSLKTKEVLEFTMDAAVELTGAERGFLILAPEPGRGRRLRVAVARNIDRERVGRSSMKYSRSIAEKVVATGEPVLTAEALSDDRFDGAHSVQAMKLKSVLSVPIRGPERTLGALYLDNRFERGLFEQQDLDVLLGFADQVGIALTNARLHDELAARTRELERERRRIARSLEERTLEVDRLSEEVRQTRDELSRRRVGGIIGRSPAMERLFAVMERVTDSSLTVLIQGESGTGKELVARALHHEGPRRELPFVTVNCAALPETLLESVLFGHRRGAFTGADRDREGLFIHAGEGTLFLDEIGELPLEMQSKLLRALQEREVQPLGSIDAVPFAARVVCATNRELDREVAAGRFREDLYYRIAVVVLEIPPLRDRLEDLPDLCRHILARLARELDRPEPALDHEALRKLLAFDFPGNVRQLENLLSQALVFCRDDLIHAEDIALPSSRVSPRKPDYREFRAREAAEIAAALRAARWNVTEVSRTLGIPRTSLYRKLKRYGLERKR